jgi:hypothetical protein
VLDLAVSLRRQGGRGVAALLLGLRRDLGVLDALDRRDRLPGGERDGGAPGDRPDRAADHPRRRRRAGRVAGSHGDHGRHQGQGDNRR